ncbi:LPS export ABC transporter periplasmic protein LptC [Candidatus Palauibacter sp.]|uniref:LPS export ABC transporter periplasmic protein LptC n=1 Tax=Candidatus Palauibacter sp. TaxID=3101350 RepID=UPI003B520C0A
MRVERVERRGRAGSERARTSGTDTLGGPVRLGLFAWVSLLPLFAACGTDDAPPTASEPLPEGVDTAVRGMRTFVTRDGIRRAVVDANTAEWHAENEIHLREMTLTFFDPRGVESTEVTAEFGIFHQLTGDLEAEGQVVVEDRLDDQRLETERLRYQNLDGRLYGDTAFRLLRGVEGLTLDGTAFESDPSLDSVVVLNQAGEMRPQVAYSEAIPLPADPVGDTTGVAEEPVAEEQGADEPAPADSTAADSTGILPDSVAARADSATVLPDTTQAPADSLAAPPDTTGALPDSLAAPPDTTAATRP